MGLFLFEQQPPPPPPQPSKIPPHEMANKAMSDEMTIGFEQIIVSFTLMIVSLCVLSRHTLSKQYVRDWMRYIWDLMKDCRDDYFYVPLEIMFGFFHRWNFRGTGGGASSNSNSNSATNTNSTDDGTTDDGNTDDDIRTNKRTLEKITLPKLSLYKKSMKRTQKGKTNYKDQNQNQQQNLLHHSNNDFMTSPIRKIQSSPMVSCIPSSIVTERITNMNTSTNTSILSAEGATSSSVHSNLNVNTNPNINMNTNSKIISPAHAPSQSPDDPYNASTSEPNTNTNTSTNLEYDKLTNEFTTLTDHEQFIKAYETHLRFSEYRRMILPPTCRLLDINQHTSFRNYKKNHKGSSSFLRKHPKRKNGNGNNQDSLDCIDGIDRDEENDDDNQNLISSIIDIVHKIVSFDYVGYMILFNIRIVKAFMCRYKRILVAWGFDVKQIVEEEEMDNYNDNEDEDDLTVGSFGSRRSLISRESGHGTSTSTKYHMEKNNSGPSVSLFNGTSMNANMNTNTNTNANVNVNSSSLQSSISGDGEKSQRERFYTTEVYNSNNHSHGHNHSHSHNHSHPKSTSTSMPTPTFTSVEKDGLLLSKEPVSGITRTDSVTSLSGFAESWEYDQRQQQQQQQQQQPFNGPQNVDELMIPSINVLLEQGEEKKDGNSLHDAQRKDSNTTASLTESLNLPSLPPIELELTAPSSPTSSSLVDHPLISGNTVVKKTKSETSTFNSLGQSSSGGRYTVLPRQTSKKKDFLEKHRNPAAFVQNQRGSTIQHHEDNKPVPLSPNKFPALEFLQNQRGSIMHHHEDNKPPVSPNKHPALELSYFDTAPNTATIQKFELDTLLPDKEGYILGDHFLEDAKDTPLLVFVNSRAGAQQGLMLKMQLRSLMNPIQVWDLADGGPEKILNSFMVFTRLRLLVCGGDGTVSWIISALNRMNVERWPPIAILPLGTGNDLARIHGWGAGYANESLLMILKQVQEAYISLLDRWAVKIERKKKRKKKKSKKEGDEIKPFTNYMSIGMDAFSALKVHNLRENSPDMFFSRAINKFLYGLHGAEDAIKASCSDLPQQIVLKADGVEIPIPEDCRGLIFLNIDSYLGGVPLWTRGVNLYDSDKSTKRRRGRRYSDGDSHMHFESMINMKRTSSFDSKIGDDVDKNDVQLERLLACDSPSSCQDGRLDIMSIRGNFHLGQIRVGLANAQKLCQCSKVEIELKNSIAIQVDGEPWKQDRSVLTIEREKDHAIMLHRATNGGGGIETEVADLLEWAEEHNFIKRDVHATLMKEFSRRIETKNRARRDRNEDNVFSVMKRGIASRNRLSNMNLNKY